MRYRHIVLMMLLGSFGLKSYARDHVFLGLDLGFAFDQDISVSRHMQDQSFTFSDDWDKGKGLVYGFHLGYKIADVHQLKLGLLMFNTSYQAGENSDEWLQSLTFSNRYLHFDYDVLLHVNSNFSWFLGPNIGMHHIEGKNITEFNMTERWETKDFGGLALGLQTGVMFSSAHVDVSLNFRYIRNVTGYEEDYVKTLPIDGAEVKLEQHVKVPYTFMTGLSLAYKI